MHPTDTAGTPAQIKRVRGVSGPPSQKKPFARQPQRRNKNPFTPVEGERGINAVINSRNPHEFRVVKAF